MVFSLSWSHHSLETRGLDRGLKTWYLGLGLGPQGCCLSLSLALTLLVPSLP